MLVKEASGVQIWYSGNEVSTDFLPLSKFDSLTKFCLLSSPAFYAKSFVPSHSIDAVSTLSCYIYISVCVFLLCKLALFCAFNMCILFILNSNLIFIPPAITSTERLRFGLRNVFQSGP